MAARFTEMPRVVEPSYDTSRSRRGGSEEEENVMETAVVDDASTSLADELSRADATPEDIEVEGTFGRFFIL